MKEPILKLHEDINYAIEYKKNTSSIIDYKAYKLVEGKKILFLTGLITIGGKIEVRHINSNIGGYILFKDDKDLDNYHELLKRIYKLRKTFYR